MTTLTGSDASRVVVVGVDAITDSSTALRWALDYAGRNGVALRIVHVWRWTPALPTTLSTDLTTDWPDSGQARARRELDTVVREVTGAGLDAAGLDVALVESGHIGEALVQSATGAEVLVIGRHDHHGTAAALGDTGRYVSLYCPCPVVVVSAPAAGHGLGARITVFETGRTRRADASPLLPVEP